VANTGKAKKKVFVVQQLTPEDSAALRVQQEQKMQEMREAVQLEARVSEAEKKLERFDDTLEHANRRAAAIVAEAHSEAARIIKRANDRDHQDSGRIQAETSRLSKWETQLVRDQSDVDKRRKAVELDEKDLQGRRKKVAERETSVLLVEDAYKKKNVDLEKIERLLKSMERELDTRQTELMAKEEQLRVALEDCRLRENVQLNARLSLQRRMEDVDARTQTLLTQEAALKSEREGIAQERAKWDEEIKAKAVEFHQVSARIAEALTREKEIIQRIEDADRREQIVAQKMRDLQIAKDELRLERSDIEKREATQGALEEEIRHLRKMVEMLKVKKLDTKETHVGN
jgi:chromosome segregation ATPase